MDFDFYYWSDKSYCTHKFCIIHTDHIIWYDNKWINLYDEKIKVEFDSFFDGEVASKVVTAPAALFVTLVGGVI